MKFQCMIFFSILALVNETLTMGKKNRQFEHIGQSLERRADKVVPVNLQFTMCHL